MSQNKLPPSIKHTSLVYFPSKTALCRQRNSARIIDTYRYVDIIDTTAVKHKNDHKTKASFASHHPHHAIQGRLFHQAGDPATKLSRRDDIHIMIVGHPLTAWSQSCLLRMVYFFKSASLSIAFAEAVLSTSTLSRSWTTYQTPWSYIYSFHVYPCQSYIFIYVFLPSTIIALEYCRAGPPARHHDQIFIPSVYRSAFSIFWVICSSLSTMQT